MSRHVICIILFEMKKPEAGGGGGNWTFTDHRFQAQSLKGSKPFLSLGSPDLTVNITTYAAYFFIPCTSKFLLY
jgi:hypothetical protein